ncbi:MAG: hypothetical protein K8F30_10695, partial [Taibaiella sp.]|nr:hypothetical protein [Taibaiella sp.]
TSEEVYIGKRVRRYYKLTEPGKKATRIYIEELRGFLKTIEELILPYPYKRLCSDNNRSINVLSVPFNSSVLLIDSLSIHHKSMYCSEIKKYFLFAGVLSR